MCVFPPDCCYVVVSIIIINVAYSCYERLMCRMLLDVPSLVINVHFAKKTQNKTRDLLVIDVGPGVVMRAHIKAESFGVRCSGEQVR